MASEELRGVNDKRQSAAGKYAKLAEPSKPVAIKDCRANVVVAQPNSITSKAIVAPTIEIHLKSALMFA